MRRQLSRGPLPASNLVVWTDTDGPIPLPPGSTGVEHRGRLGHPTSYGLIAGHLSQHFTIGLRRVEMLPQLPIETPVDGLEDAAYAAAIAEASHRWQTPFTLTAAVSGEVGSSVVEFARLASLLALVLAAPTTPDDDLWQRWDAGWQRGSLII